MKTFGEFFDAVLSWHKRNGSPAVAFLENWAALVSPEKWQEVRGMEFTLELYYAFAEDMASMFTERLQGICTDALYERVMKEGHLFLLALIAIGTDFGLTVDPDEVNVPLSISDALVRAQSRKNHSDPD